MTFLPVAQRELALLARRPRTYTARNFTALIVILASLGMLYAGFGGLLSAGAAGRNLFLFLSLGAGAYVLVDGVLMTADCLSQEKREGTIGLLFLTDLKGYDVVAGKLISRAANSSYCLLAALPALGIALFLGGVTGSDYVHMIAALLNGLFFAASLGMLVSALCCQERWAINLALGAVLSLGVLLPAAGWCLSYYQKSTRIEPVFLVGSPAGAFLYALSFRAAPTTLGFSFSSTLGLVHLLGWCCLGLASIALPRWWRSEFDSAALASALRSANGAGSQPPPRASRKRLQDMFDQNPLLWLEERRRGCGLGMWPFFLVFGMGWLVTWNYVGKHWPTMPFFLGSILLLHLGFAYFVLLAACRGTVEDQRNGLLETLLTTPLDDGAYLRGRLLSIKRQCLWPMLGVFCLDLIFLSTAVWDTGAWNWEWFGCLVSFVVLGIKLLVDLYVISWVGLWQSLKTRSTSQAVRRTVFYVVLMRWIILLGFVALVGLVTQGRVFQSPSCGVAIVVGYLALAAATILHYCGAAMNELHDNLRSLATDGMEEIVGWKIGGIFKRRKRPVAALRPAMPEWDAPR